MKIRSRYPLASAIAAGSLLAFASGAANAVETEFTGYTDGCFAVSPATTCTNTASPGVQTATLGGLVYTDSTFDVTTAGGFAGIGNGPATPNVDNLGSFDLSSMPYSYTGQHFDLLVTFTAPPGTSPGSYAFNDTLTGTVASNAAGGVYVDFDNTPKTFTFDGGSFTFSVNDVSVTTDRSAAVTGTVIATVSPVPEPETYALFLAGLAALGFISRRRRR